MKTTQTIGAVCGARPLEGLGGLAGCKVLRQDDKKHSPSHFAAANPNVGLVIDVSSETPPYLPGDLACRYVKLPTQSKVPPNDANVASLIDITREFWEAPENKGKDIALHCHYGFNRTGYLVCCWMVEQRGYTPTAALAEVGLIRGNRCVATTCHTICTGCSLAPLVRCPAGSHTADAV